MEGPTPSSARRRTHLPLVSPPTQHTGRPPCRVRSRRRPIRPSQPRRQLRPMQRRSRCPIRKPQDSPPYSSPTRSPNRRSEPHQLPNLQHPVHPRLAQRQTRRRQILLQTMRRISTTHQQNHLRQGPTLGLSSLRTTHDVRPNRIVITRTNTTQTDLRQQTMLRTQKPTRPSRPLPSRQTPPQRPTHQSPSITPRHMARDDHNDRTRNPQHVFLHTNRS